MENEEIKAHIGEMQISRESSHPSGTGNGLQQRHVAAALGVSDATLSRMFLKGFAKELTKVATGRVEAAEA